LKINFKNEKLKINNKKEINEKFLLTLEYLKKNFIIFFINEESYDFCDCLDLNNIILSNFNKKGNKFNNFKDKKFLKYFSDRSYQILSDSCSRYIFLILIYRC
jgi:hypothetical protein